METPQQDAPKPPEGGTEPQPGGEGPVYVACAGLVLLAFLPWINFSLAGTQFGDMHRNMGEMFSAMGVSTTVSGYQTWAGRIAIIAGLACAGLTWAESSGALAWKRGNALLGAAGCAAVGAGAALFAVLDFGRMSQISLFLALAAGGAALYFSFARVREFGQRRRGAPS